MLIAVILLALVCAALLFRLFMMERDLRATARRIRQEQKGDGAARLRLSAPNAAAEELMSAVNDLLELRRTDAAQYRERDAALRRQIANVSHDLRTPLTSILGYLQLLEEGTLSEEERREYLSVIEGRARTLQELITAFYDLSRMEGGEYPLVMEPVDLYRELSALMAEFYGELEERFRVTVELEEGLPPVMADRNAVIRIFTNLIGNAVKHGTGEFHVVLKRRGNFLVTSFSNRAPGLTQEDVAHVFDRFYTADKTRTGRNTGLGLAIVKTLARQMGHSVCAGLTEDVFSVAVTWRLE